MSTYNGERFIRQQIETILCQKNVQVSLIVRDDGSNDATLDILDEYKNKGLLKWYTGDNLGPAKSFMHLLENAPEFEYYSFADQDDIWYPLKLNKAVEAIRTIEKEKSSSKILYVCNKNVVDANGHIKYYAAHKFKQSAGLAFLECHSSGCCMVMNSKLRNYVCTHKPKEWIMLHDYWVYLIANSLGKVIFDNEPLMGYRIHGNNAAGIDEVGFFTKIKRLFSKDCVKYHASDIAEILIEACGTDMPNTNLKLVNIISKSGKSFWARLYMILSPQFTIVGGNFKQKIYAKLKILQKKNGLIT